MAFINRIRLPIELCQPQFPEEADTFRFANGATKALNVIIFKEYNLVTATMPTKWHERLKIAIRHDNLEFEGEQYVGGAVQQGAYEINYPDFKRRSLAPANTKIRVTPFDASNNNCGICETYQQVDTQDDLIGTLGEDETVDVAILYNDSICCDPFSISLITFDSDYLDSAVLIGNVLRIKTKIGLTTQNNVVLATYRVTCDGNAMFDEANIIANIEGTVEGCLSPLTLTPTDIGSTTAHILITPPDPAPACGYNWQLFEAQNPGVPIDSGTTTDLELIFHPIFPNTDYRVAVQGNCCDDLVSNFVETEFTTLPPSGGGGGGEETCGNYWLSFTDPEGNPGSYIQAQYQDCNSNFKTITLLNGQTFAKCLLQTAPNEPVSLEVIFYTGGMDTPVNVDYEYIAPC